MLWRVWRRGGSGDAEGSDGGEGLDGAECLDGGEGLDGGVIRDNDWFVFNDLGLDCSGEPSGRFSNRDY